ncbi:hypothetical protein BDN70DRAFT_879054 [Pholiota conissans]|uniref:Uncharacterized protein n=1 Tax=Pholiota conissans TaxID=109636 RepID=A0A9P6D0B0_9AGAR|nr:hypothetical protein BDN70DRAFT_879054 [Pholiota conissans]
MRTKHEFEPAMLYIAAYVFLFVRSAHYPFALCSFRVTTSALYLSVTVILISLFWSPFLEGEVGKSAAIQQYDCITSPSEQSFETPSYPSLRQGDRRDDETKD